MFTFIRHIWSETIKKVGNLDDSAVKYSKSFMRQITFALSSLPVLWTLHPELPITCDWLTVFRVPWCSERIMSPPCLSARLIYPDLNVASRDDASREDRKTVERHTSHQKIASAEYHVERSVCELPKRGISR